MLRRRGFIVGSASALALTPRRTRAASRAACMVLYDPDHAAARRLAALAGSAGAVVCAVSGDRFRLMRDLLAATPKPAMLVGIGSRTDHLLLCGTAAEAGFRQRGEAVHLDGWHDCHGSLRRLSGDLVAASSDWPDLLAVHLFGQAATDMDGTGRTGRANGARAVISWVAFPRRRA